MPSSRMWRHVALVGTDVSEERMSIILVTRIDKLEQFHRRELRLLVTGKVLPRSLILVTLMLEAIRSFETSVPTRSNGVMSRNTAFFYVDYVRTSQETRPVTAIAFLFYMSMMYRPHRKHRYEPSRHVTGIALFLYVNDVRTLQETHVLSTTVCYGNSFFLLLRLFFPSELLTRE
jgi:hypothetical protein